MVQEGSDSYKGERLASEYVRTREGELKTPEEQLREMEESDSEIIGFGGSLLGDDMLTTLEEQDEQDRRLEQQYTAAYDIHPLDRAMLPREETAHYGELEKHEDELAFEQQKLEEDDWPLGQLDPTSPSVNYGDDSGLHEK